MAVSNSSKKLVDASGSYVSLIGALYSLSDFMENSPNFSFRGIEATKSADIALVFKPFRM